MNTIVIYKSKYGHTRTYAQWISEELNCDLRCESDITVEEMGHYDTIIYGGAVYVGSIKGLNLIKNNFTLLAGKNIVVWATGMSKGSDNELDTLWDHNFTDEQLKLVKLFYLRGGLNYKNLNIIDKILINAPRLMISLKKDKTKEDQEILDAFDTPVNFCNKENIKDLINYIKSL